MSLTNVNVLMGFTIQLQVKELCDLHVLLNVRLVAAPPHLNVVNEQLGITQYQELI